MHRIVASLTLSLALFGCMVGPDYQRPQVDVPQIWRVEDKSVQAVTNTSWWEQYNDPVLNGLVQSALQDNKDVKIAAARIDQFLGLYTTTRAALFPQVFAGTTASRQRLSELVGPFSQLESASGIAGTSPTFTNFQIFVSSTWEIDFWGKLRRATEAARASMLASEEAKKSVILTLITSVTNSYINTGPRQAA